MLEKDWRRESYAMTLEFQDVCPLSDEELADLLERDIIIDLNSPGSKVFYDYFEINPNYQNLFSLKVVPWVSEIVDMYPRFFYMEGRRYNAVTVGAEEVAESYIKAIDNNPEMHKEVYELTKWAIDNDCIKMGVEKYIKTKHWLSIKMMRSESKRTVNESTLG